MSSKKKQRGKKKKQGTHECCICLCGAGEGPVVHGGCACRGSAGWAHVACQAKAAQNQADTSGVCGRAADGFSGWDSCSTCRQYWTGAMQIGLARACWETVRSLPEFIPERISAMSRLAIALHECEDDISGSLKLMTQGLEIDRRVFGRDSDEALHSLKSCGALLIADGSPAEAVPMLEEAVEGFRRRLGDGHSHTLNAMKELADAHKRLQHFEKAIPMARQCVRLYQQTLGAEDPKSLMAVVDLGTHLSDNGEYAEALPLLQEAVRNLRKVLGAGHPSTEAAVAACETVHGHAKRQERMRALQGTRAELAPQPEPETTVVEVKIVGLVSATELNGCRAEAVSWHAEKERYCCRVFIPTTADDTDDTIDPTKNVTVKPANVQLLGGTQVMVTGVKGAPELNGQLGTIRGDGLTEGGRYGVAIEGRNKYANLKPENVRLIFAREQGQ
eukprot:COSAG02_NODE_983_length_15470_cov_4.269924_6_plen_446_part_00